jgi:hypothetical protein
MNKYRNSYLTYYIPVLFFCFLIAADKYSPNFLPGLTRSEYGLVENLQAILLALSLYVVLTMLIRRGAMLPRYMKYWLWLIFFGCTYILLEEISYGQHYFGYDTPDKILALNDQQETNLHNMSSWFDQKPRTLLEIGIIITGLLIPLIRRVRPLRISERLESLLPRKELFMVALLAIIPRMYERLMESLELNNFIPFERTSEVQELYFYYFFLIYLLVFRLERSSAKEKSEHVKT